MQTLTAASVLEQKKHALITYLNAYPDLAIAVSGGVDSLLLAYLAHKKSTANITVYHAHSPAVPQTAYTRLTEFAAQYGWALTCLNANELNDKNYTKNPVNRCFFCKSQLFSHIQAATQTPICSGTNMDDLSDYRPGLEAAKNHQVLQPYVEANITKADIYALAKSLNLTPLESLPAQPCLASRVETGIAIDARDLTLIDTLEQLVVGVLSPKAVVRCRITHAGVYIELGNEMHAPSVIAIKPILIEHCIAANKIFAGIRPYKKGAAFLQVGKTNTASTTLIDKEHHE